MQQTSKKHFVFVRPQTICQRLLFWIISWVKVVKACEAKAVQRKLTALPQFLGKLPLKNGGR